MAADKDVIQKLFEQFGYTWFTAKMARMSLAELRRLEHEGYLDLSKGMHTSNLNFRVRKEVDDHEGYGDV
jgi:hypothetical protein